MSLTDLYTKYQKSSLTTPELKELRNKLEEICQFIRVYPNVLTGGMVADVMSMDTFIFNRENEK